MYKRKAQSIPRIAASERWAKEINDCRVFYELRKIVICDALLQYRYQSCVQIGQTTYTMNLSEPNPTQEQVEAKWSHILPQNTTGKISARRLLIILTVFLLLLALFVWKFVR